MGNLAANVALGRLNEFAERVNNNDPANASFELFLWEGTSADDNFGDADTVADVEALSGISESSATNYASIVLQDGDIGASTVDDSANTRDFDIADQVWSSLGPGTAITRLTIGYDSDDTGGTDANIENVAIYDFSVIPNGGNVTAQINASGLWSAARA